MLIEFFLANSEKFIAIISLIIVSLLTRFTVGLNYQNWIKTFSGTLTLLLLPIITYSITSVISGNIALSLGMIGALSIVRFRNPVRSSFELVIFFFMISLGICAAVDLRWLVVLGFGCNLIIITTYFLNIITTRFWNKNLFLRSFSEGNSLNVLEISSSVNIDKLIQSNLLTFYNFDKEGYIFRLASEDEKILKEISNNYVNDPSIKEIKFIAG